ncbi:MAG: WD40 repeat domain-containing protein [Lentisphaerae bacterium]|nr:WD40 repeat domain-containing protein [Lentisphaerota bacterium]
MQPVPFYAKDLSVNAQSFLYACAFWTVASDESLNPEEQEWLIDQFGEAGATQSLEDFVSLESDEFLAAFDAGASGLTVEEKQIVFPNLVTWLLSCARTDGLEGPDERQTIEKIKARLSLDEEVRRLEGDEEDQEPMEVVPVDETAETAKPSDEHVVAEERLLVGHDGGVTSVCVSEDGQWVLSGSDDGTVRLWDFETGTGKAVLEGHSLGVTCVRFMPNEFRAVSSDRRGCVMCHDLSSGDTLWVQDPGRRGGVTCLDVSRDGKQIALSCDIGILSLLDAAGKETRTFGERKRGAIHTVAFSRDGKQLLSGGDDRALNLWNAQKGQHIRTLTGHDDGVACARFSAAGTIAVSASRDNSVRTWDLESGDQIRVFEGHSFSVISACFDEEDKYVLSASWDHTVRLWERETGRCVYKLESVGAGFSDAVFHPTTPSIVGACGDRAVHVVQLKAPE